MLSVLNPIRYQQGFTLIELLIVIAIILILIAIALPNFLEAQIRAKVTKAAADTRSLATGMESYFIDWNSYTNDCPGPEIPRCIGPPKNEALITYSGEPSYREFGVPTGTFPVSGAGVPWTVSAPTNGTKNFGGIIVTGGVSLEHSDLSILNRLTHL